MTTLTVSQVLEAAQIYNETVKNIQQRFIYLTYKLCDRVSELTHLSSVKGFYRQLSQCQREIECDESMSMDFACIQAFEPEHACFQKNNAKPSLYSTMSTIVKWQSRTFSFWASIRA
ncbi:hypothetical protein [Avibacterium volantium]|uniref:hypothetical protein n=1 Tax=Avibacterium TaxID=292486 RepID=UPI003BF85EB4